MRFNIIVLPSFIKDIKYLSKKYPSIKSDISLLQELLLKNPFSGEPLGKDCYKIRMSITSKGRGKSGRARIITCVRVVHKTIYLVSIYDKSDKDSISSNELIELIKGI